MSDLGTSALFNAQALLEHVQILEEDVGNGDWDNALAITIDIGEYLGRVERDLDALMEEA